MPFPTGVIVPAQGGVGVDLQRAISDGGYSEPSFWSTSVESMVPVPELLTIVPVRMLASVPPCDAVGARPLLTINRPRFVERESMEAKPPDVPLRPTVVAGAMVRILAPVMTIEPLSLHQAPPESVRESPE